MNFVIYQPLKPADQRVQNTSRNPVTYIFSFQRDYSVDTTLTDSTLCQSEYIKCVFCTFCDTIEIVITTEEIWFKLTYLIPT